MNSFLMSAKSGDQVKLAFLKIAAALSGSSIHVMSREVIHGIVMNVIIYYILI